MITKVFAVYDTKAAFFASPFFMQSVGMATRAFSDAVNDRSTMLSKHPEDFILYEIGTFDDGTGELMALGKHVNLGHGSDFKVEGFPGGPLVTGSPVVPVTSDNGKES